MFVNLASLKVGNVVRMLRAVQVDQPFVQYSGREYTKGQYVYGLMDYGHIVRFSRNVTGEVIVVVDWSTGDRTAVYPGDLEVPDEEPWVL